MASEEGAGSDGMGRVKRTWLRLQFRLRTMLVLVAVVALFCGWLGSGLAEARRQRRAVEGLTSLGGEVSYEDECSYPTVTPWWNARRWLYALTGDAQYQTVVCVTYPREQELTDAEWEYYLKAFPWAGAVLLTDCYVEDRHLRHLRGMRRLEEVRIGPGRVTGEGLEYLQEIPTLRLLMLEEIEFSQAGKRALGKLVSLEDLSLGDCGDDETLAHLESLTKMTRLDLTGGQVTDAGMVHVGKLRWLRRLRIHGDKITGVGLEHLATLENLEVLDLSHTRVTDETLVHLAKLPKLASLGLERTPLTDKAVPHLQNLRNLRSLSLNLTRVSQAGRQKLAQALPGLRVDKLDALAYWGRGFTSAQKGDLEDALSDLTEAIALDPRFSEAYSSRGHVYLAKSKFDEAIADFNEAIALAPGVPSSHLSIGDAYNGRGIAYAKKGELDKAIADFTEAMRRSPKYVESYYNRARAYLAKRQFDKAIGDYNEAIRIDPFFVTAHWRRGIAYARKGDLDSAIADLTEAIRQDPQSANAYWTRGIVYSRKAQQEKANADLAEAARLNPKLAGLRPHVGSDDDLEPSEGILQDDYSPFWTSQVGVR